MDTFDYSYVFQIIYLTKTKVVKNKCCCRDAWT